MNRMFITGQIVTLVTIPEYLPVLMMPHTGEYENPYILKLTPCNKRNGKYYDLRNGREVSKTDTTLEWMNLSGTVFRYPDGLNVLISKKFNSDILLGIPVAANEISSLMIPRKIFDRSKKKNAA